MTHFDAYQIPTSDQSRYETDKDFCKFTGDPNRLYLLAFLLTANHEMAEQCFVPGLEDCADGNAVFREWAASWTRRIIVRNAVRIIEPHKGKEPHKGECQPAEIADKPAGKRRVLEMPVQEIPFASVLRLNDFERFVYVLSVLERLGDQECAVLLGISCEEIREKRALAIQHVSGSQRTVALVIDHPSAGNS